MPGFISIGSSAIGGLGYLPKKVVVMEGAHCREGVEVHIWTKIAAILNLVGVSSYSFASVIRIVEQVAIASKTRLVEINIAVAHVISLISKAATLRFAHIRESFQVAEKSISCIFGYTVREVMKIRSLINIIQDGIKRLWVRVYQKRGEE
jgi:hypothetical protein